MESEDDLEWIKASPPLQETLIVFARGYLRALVGSGEFPEEPGLPESATARSAGMFVTLSLAGKLRGCMGSIRASAPLLETLKAEIRASAFEDPRFPPLQKKELERLVIELSVLGRLRTPPSWKDIVPGRHGVLLRLGGKGAVFLPQVAGERGWSLEETLGQLSLKAGLEKGAWLFPGCDFQVFEAWHWKEKGPSP